MIEENKTTNESIPVELMLLNHLFCHFARSAFTGMSWVDDADLLRWYLQQSELIFEYEFGSDPEVIIQNILGRLTEGHLAASYSVLFGRDGLTYPKYLSEITEKLRAEMAYVPAVIRINF